MAGMMRKPSKPEDRPFMNDFAITFADREDETTTVHFYGTELSGFSIGKTPSVFKGKKIRAKILFVEGEGRFFHLPSIDVTMEIEDDEEGQRMLKKWRRRQGGDIPKKVGREMFTVQRFDEKPFDNGNDSDRIPARLRAYRAALNVKLDLEREERERVAPEKPREERTKVKTLGNTNRKKESKIDVDRASKEKNIIAERMASMLKLTSRCELDDSEKIVVDGPLINLGPASFPAPPSITSDDSAISTDGRGAVVEEKWVQECRSMPISLWRVKKGLKYEPEIGVEGTSLFELEPTQTFEGHVESVDVIVTNDFSVVDGFLELDQDEGYTIRTFSGSMTIQASRMICQITGHCAGEALSISVGVVTLS